ncbi:MAG: bifunctional 23S rRNA (guanine(2069)-N(7))-methyltransferase RlmK/23S rRNA (guanine(2445)-N(2))-methyltransferase RlmL [Pirellulaceae bacterium]
MTLDLIAVCAFGLEAIVRRELTELGYESKVLSPGRLLFHADVSAICRCNMWLRSADRILVRVCGFEADHFDALFDQARDQPWDCWLPVDAKFPVSGKSLKSKLSSVPAIQRTVKKAIVLGMQRVHRTENLPETGPEFSLEITLLNDVATLTIDTTGPGLHKRPYGLGATPSHVKETLAASLVLLSFWKRDRPLIDPFCSSGAIAIEAAMIGCRVAPGLERRFAAQSWPWISQSLWRQTLDEALQLRLPALQQRIVATDTDERSLAIARQNACRAGVDESIHFQRRHFEALASSREFGCIITHVPFEDSNRPNPEQNDLYRSIPLVLRQLPTWSHYILTAHPRLEQVVGRQADRRRKLFNGRTECTYYQFYGPKPGSYERPIDVGDNDSTANTAGVPSEDTETQSTDVTTVPTSAKTNKVTTPAFGGLTNKAHHQADLFRTRLLKRARHLRRLPTRQGVTCYRLYERGIPEIPLVVDRYEDHLHINEYDRPHDRDPAQHANWLDLMAKTASDCLQIPKGQTFLKRRGRQAGSSQHEHVADDRYEIEVQEGGLKFIVNLSDYVDTGLFLDHRLTRAMFRGEASGKSVLNLFAYTGAFSVYAADGGAAMTTTVDWSNTYLDWARRNMALNGFDSLQHRYRRESAIDFIAQHPVETTYDLAIVDPPTFSNSKRTEDVWEVQSGYASLLNGLMPLMHSGGVIYFSSNFRRFKFDTDAFADCTIREISTQTVPPEYRNRRIHRCWRIVKS